MELTLDTSKYQSLALPVGTILDFPENLVRRGYQYLEIAGVNKITPSYIVYNALSYYADTNKAEELLVYEDFQVCSDKRGNDGKQVISTENINNGNPRVGFTKFIIERSFEGRRWGIVQILESYGEEYGLNPSYLRANNTRYYIPSIRNPMLEIFYNESNKDSTQVASVLYGPPPVSRKKKSLWGVIIFVISVILGGLIYFGYRMISTVYGPPPVDVRHDVEPDVYGPPPIRQEMIPESPMKEDALYESRD